MSNELSVLAATLNHVGYMDVTLNQKRAAYRLWCGISWGILYSPIRDDLAREAWSIRAKLRRQLTESTNSRSASHE